MTNAQIIAGQKDLIRRLEDAKARAQAENQELRRNLAEAIKCIQDQNRRVQ